MPFFLHNSLGMPSIYGRLDLRLWCGFAGPKNLFSWKGYSRGASSLYPESWVPKNRAMVRACRYGAGLGQF